MTPQQKINKNNRIMINLAICWVISGFFLIIIGISMLNFGIKTTLVVTGAIGSVLFFVFLIIYITGKIFKI